MTSGSCCSTDYRHCTFFNTRPRKSFPLVNLIGEGLNINTSNHFLTQAIEVRLGTSRPEVRLSKYSQSALLGKTKQVRAQGIRKYSETGPLEPNSEALQWNIGMQREHLYFISHKHNCG